MNETHLKYLIEIGDSTQGYVGNNSLKWGNATLSKTDTLDQYLDRRLDRYELFEYCQNEKNDDLNVLIAILSWGGMRRDHGRILLNNPGIVLALVQSLRNGDFHTRRDAFSSFQKHRMNGSLPGLGIGYFTKLICFLAPSLNGYIMDQWVAKSINLLTGDKIVSISNNVWVNDINNCDTYEKFCGEIDKLATMLGCTGFEAEKRIFSVGRRKGQWRNYVIGNYNF